MFHYKFNENEITELLKSIIILVDTREKQNQHILDYFDSKNIPYEYLKLAVGDYSIKLPANMELGLKRDIYFPITIERKNSVDELVQSFIDRSRFENELIRSQNYKFLLLVEDSNGYENILCGNYQSQYNKKAFLASLKTFEARYDYSTVFIPKKATGNYIYHHFYYFVRNYLKGY